MNNHNQTSKIHMNLYIHWANESENAALEAVANGILDDCFEVKDYPSGIIHLFNRRGEEGDSEIIDCRFPSAAPRGQTLLRVGTQLATIIQRLEELEQHREATANLRGHQENSKVVGYDITACGDGSIHVGCKDLEAEEAERAVAFFAACVKAPKKGRRAAIGPHAFVYRKSTDPDEDTDDKGGMRIYIDGDGGFSLDQARAIVAFRAKTIKAAQKQFGKTK